MVELVSVTDIGLCGAEIAKLIAVLRTTERYSDVTKPAIMWPREVLGDSSANVGSKQAAVSQTVSSSPGQTSVSPESSKISSASSTPVVVPSIAPNETVTAINTVAQLVTLQASLRQGRVDVLHVLAPFAQVIMDPALSGFVTSAALASVYQFLTAGSPETFLKNPVVAGGIVDCVTKTRFTETDRDHDEVVLLRIVSIVETVLLHSPADKARIALGLQCMQSVWIQDNHSAALKDAARQAVSKILLHVMRLQGGCEGYALTLLDNVCLNIELLAKQSALTFDADKLGFFVDVISTLSRSDSAVAESAKEILPFELMHALHHLIPAGPAAAAIDTSGSSILARNAMGLPIASALLTVGNSLVREALAAPASASALLIEALVTSMYCRGLCPQTETELKLAGVGEVALDLLTTKKAVSASLAPNGYINLVQSAAITQQLSPHVQQTQATLLEGLGQLLKEPGFVATVWESFDCVWHRQELATGLIDSVVNTALSNRVIALLPPPAGAEETKPERHERDRVLRSLASFHALATSPESIIDPEALVPSYVECLSMDCLKDMVLSLHGSLGQPSGKVVGDETPQQFLMRLSSRETSKQIKAKPKKASEIAHQFFTEFERYLKTTGGEHAEGPQLTARLMRLIPSVDFDALGEFFGQPTDASTQAMAAFIKSLNLRAMDPEEALRACLQSFRLPGEAQQIDRIVKEIAYEYYASHSDLSIGGNFFASADAAYTFLFSVIMLNTDQHNPQVKKRMELRDFVRNNRKINDGNDIPEEVQSRVFASIRASQIVTPKSASFFCAPLKGRWKDLWYLNKTGYIPNQLRVAGKHSVHRLLSAKGYDILVAAAYVLARDPKRYTRALEVVAGLAELSLAVSSFPGVDPVVRSLGADCVGILRRYAVKSFAHANWQIQPTPRSFDSLAALLKLTVGGSADALLEAVCVMLSLWAPYEPLIDPAYTSSSLANLPPMWEDALSVPTIDLGPQSHAQSGGAISSLFRGFLNPLLEPQMKSDEEITSSPIVVVPDSVDGEYRKSSSVSSLTMGEWRKEILRSSFTPASDQLMALRGVQVERFLEQVIDGENGKCSAVVLMILEVILGSTKNTVDDVWQRELLRSAPWALLLVARILTAAKHSDLIAASPARDAVLAVIRQYVSGQLVDMKGLKTVVFSSFAFVTFFAKKDPRSNVVDPAWILPVLDELISLAQEKAAVAAISPAVCLSVQMMHAETPKEWLCQVGAPVWRECIKLIASCCPKSKTGGSEVDSARRVAQETVFSLLTDEHVLLAFSNAANGSHDMGDSVVALEQVLQSRLTQRAVSKSLADFACKLAGTAVPGAGIAWTSVVARLTARVTSVAKSKKPTAPELSDSVELLRICLGDPRAVQILSPAQAGATVEKCASALSAVVSANTPPGTLQAALSVFARFFLTCMEKLQQHPQFDHLWLMSLRVILLFIKKGHDDVSMEQLAEITTETLRNALQVLVATGSLELPPLSTEAHEPPVVWWKVTWEIVETFCPGMWNELRGGPAALSPSVEPTVIPEVPTSLGGIGDVSDERTGSDEAKSGAEGHEADSREDVEADDAEIAESGYNDALPENASKGVDGTLPHEGEPEVTNAPAEEESDRTI